MIADLETPVSAMIKLVGGAANSFLLESVEGGSIRGRYSFLGLKPDLIWRCHGNRAEINRHALDDPAAFQPCPVSEDAGTLASFRAVLVESRIDLPAGLPSMAAGLFGYLGYDAVRPAEDIPDANPKCLDVPDGQFLRPTIITVFDTIEDLVTVVTPVWQVDGVSADRAYQAGLSRLAKVLDDFDQSLAHNAGDQTRQFGEPRSNMTEAEFCAIVEKGKEYILAGDVFQVVLSQQFSMPFDLPPLAFYRALRRINPSHSCFSWISGIFPSSGPAPNCWSACAPGASPSGPWPAPAGAAPTTPRIAA